MRPAIVRSRSNPVNMMIKWQSQLIDNRNKLIEELSGCNLVIIIKFLQFARYASTIPDKSLHVNMKESKKKRERKSSKVDTRLKRDTFRDGVDLRRSSRHFPSRCS